MISGGPMVQMNWCTGDAHTIRLTGGDPSQLDLLLAIPPTPPRSSPRPVWRGQPGSCPHRIEPTLPPPCNPPLLLPAGISTDFPRSLRQYDIRPTAKLTGQWGSQAPNFCGPTHKPPTKHELMNAHKLSEDDMDAPVEIVVTSRNVDVSEHF
jgi:hypothetical protein